MKGGMIMVYKANCMSHNAAQKVSFVVYESGTPFKPP